MGLTGSTGPCSRCETRVQSYGFSFLDLVCMVEVFDKPCRISEYGILVRGLGLSGAFRISTEIEPIKPLLVIFDWRLGLWGSRDWGLGVWGLLEQELWGPRNYWLVQ